MPSELTVIDIENAVKEVRDSLNDLREESQNLEILLDFNDQVLGPEVFGFVEDLRTTRRELSEKFERLRQLLKRELRF